ncbi:hypothetical protein [Actinoplanes sp. NPDC049681]|uniref:hypothetical protein n=1 Tax=Actinoplanes sp. NPDC049681 TaxID=3363905 RepID=UPI0037A00576
MTRPDHEGPVPAEADDQRVVADGSFPLMVLMVDQLPDLHELMLVSDGQHDPVRVPLPAR